MGAGGVNAEAEAPLSLLGLPSDNSITRLSGRTQSHNPLCQYQGPGGTAGACSTGPAVTMATEPKWKKEASLNAAALSNGTVNKYKICHIGHVINLTKTISLVCTLKLFSYTVS